MSYGRKISIVALGSGAGAQPVVIMDETTPAFAGSARPDACQPGLLFGGDGDVAQTPLVRSPYMFLAYRFNVLETLELLVRHTFVLYGSTQDFAAQRRSAIPATGKLMLSTTTEQGTFQRSYPMAFVKTVKCTELAGVGCVFRYVILLNTAYTLTP